MQITIDINESAKAELTKSFGVNDVKEAVEALINRYVDRYSEERKIANNVLQGIKEVKEGKTKDIKELFDAI